MHDIHRFLRLSCCLVAAALFFSCGGGVDTQGDAMGDAGDDTHEEVDGTDMAVDTKEEDPVEELAEDPVEEDVIEDSTDVTEECTHTVAITDVSPLIIAHGAQAVTTGTGFTGATDVQIGDVSQTFTEDSDTQITIPAVDDATPVNTQNLTVVVVDCPSEPMAVIVIHLVLNEVDADDPGHDDQEFIDISTSVPAISLADYVLVFLNGSDDASYMAFDLGAGGAITDSNGLLLVGNSGVYPAPAITFEDNSMQNGADAVAIYQGAVDAWPNDTAITAAGLIDALVYDTSDGDDAGLLVPLLGSGPEGVQVDENGNNAREAESMHRCGPARLDGREFIVQAPVSPGLLNSCP